MTLSVLARKNCCTLALILSLTAIQPAQAIGKSHHGDEMLACGLLGFFFGVTMTVAVSASYYYLNPWPAPKTSAALQQLCRQEQRKLLNQYHKCPNPYNCLPHEMFHEAIQLEGMIGVYKKPPIELQVPPYSPPLDDAYCRAAREIDLKDNFDAPYKHLVHTNENNEFQTAERWCGTPAFEKPSLEMHTYCYDTVFKPFDYPGPIEADDHHWLSDFLTATQGRKATLSDREQFLELTYNKGVMTSKAGGHWRTTLYATQHGYMVRGLHRLAACQYNNIPKIKLLAQLQWGYPHISSDNYPQTPTSAYSHPFVISMGEASSGLSVAQSLTQFLKESDTFQQNAQQLLARLGSMVARLHQHRLAEPMEKIVDQLNLKKIEFTDIRSHSVHGKPNPDNIFLEQEHMALADIEGLGVAHLTAQPITLDLGWLLWSIQHWLTSTEGLSDSDGHCAAEEDSCPQALSISETESLQQSFVTGYAQEWHEDIRSQVTASLRTIASHPSSYIQPLIDATFLSRLKAHSGGNNYELPEKD